MFLYMRFDGRNDYIGALHHPTTNHNKFRIVGVNQTNSIRCPNFETSIADSECNVVTVRSFLEKIFESDIGIF